MNFTPRLVTAAAIAALLPAANALAADYDPPIIMDDAVVDYAPEVPVEIGTGWYLRGDVGYSVMQSTEPFTFRSMNPITGAISSNTYDTTDLSNPITFGGGFGFRFTDYIRADVTIDVFKQRFEGTGSWASPCIAADVGTTCRSADESAALSATMLANAYVDLGTYVGFTPYVGAGVGATYVKWDDTTRRNFCVGGACDGDLMSVTSHNGSEGLRFTWAVMGGLAYDVSDTMKIDLGYRYRRVAGGSMYEWDGASQAGGATGVQGGDGGQSHHEVRVGLRYELW